MKLPPEAQADDRALRIDPSNGCQFIVGPELGRVSELMLESWARPCWNYDAGLLGAHILRPSGDATLAIGQETDGPGSRQLVSYQAFMPFQVCYLGKPYKAVFASSLTVHPSFHGQGMAGPQQAGLLNEAIDRGYDFYLTMCEVGAPSNRAVEKVFARMGLEVQVIHTLHYLAARVNGALSEPSASTRLYEPEDFETVAALAETLGGDVPLRKVVPREDLSFILAERPHTRTYVFSTGGRVRAMVNLLLLDVLDKTARVNAYFDNIHFGDLNASEQAAFVSDIMSDLNDEGVYAALFPNIGYAPAEPFVVNRFHEAPRRLNLYRGSLKEGFELAGIRNVDRFYLDVY